jgi:large subunit ribosomal protein L6
MARVLNPITIPAGVTVTINGQMLSVKGSKTTVEYLLPANVNAQQDGSTLRFLPEQEGANLAMVGTTRALVSNLFKGVSAGFQKKLELVGVGYRAQSQGKVLNIALGFSHPINYNVPDGITIETPTQTEILVKGTDKQLVGQVAADIRQFRPPEPYKGKGIRYAGETILLKEAKKK